LMDVPRCRLAVAAGGSERFEGQWVAVQLAGTPRRRSISVCTVAASGCGECGRARGPSGKHIGRPRWADLPPAADTGRKASKWWVPGKARHLTEKCPEDEVSGALPPALSLQTLSPRD
jgi:hypothetical protein